jgi:pyruvate dehydrogenase E1 component
VASTTEPTGTIDVGHPYRAGIEVLGRIQQYVLWLSVNMIHHANRVRPNTSGVKVGGHQASVASVVTIMTELFFEFLRAEDLLSVKPHAAPVLHAIHYLLGGLERSQLTEFRAFGGLQAYPSRTKDPDPVDFSTGSVGLGSIAPNFAALVDRFIGSRRSRNSGPKSRFVSLLGDAELDEGSVWEAVAEPALAGLENVLWIVDVNRQSLDRIVPGIRVRQLEQMFDACGWSVVEAKYGTRLERQFRETAGLRDAIDAMTNEEYQLLLRSEPARIAQALGDATPDVPASDLRDLLADLGGHDFAVLRRALAEADAVPRPAVIFAYTIKGWHLDIAGDPLNHSALLSNEQIADLRRGLHMAEEDDWPTLEPTSAEGRLAAVRRGELARRTRRKRRAQPAVPEDLAREFTGSISTQQALGQVLTDLLRAAPDLAKQLVTVSPDVATSTNLGGWINRIGIWSEGARPDPFAELGQRLISWSGSPGGQHFELGISETNLMMMLGQLGLAAEYHDETLLPIGTVYDPFVARGLDPLIYALYSGAGIILVGTPSGVSLAPEGGAHQSVITPTIGLALPGITYWEPCFAQELEWIMLASLEGLLHRRRASSAYLRLSTLPVDQGLFPVGDRSALRQLVLSGAYRIIDRSQRSGAHAGNTVDIWATGVTVPAALRAAESLQDDGIFASVVNCVSPGLVYRRWQDSVHLAMSRLSAMNHAGHPPVVTVIDGHPSGLSWIGSMLGVAAYPLGVSDYGQSGLPTELHHHFEIDEEAISYAAYVAVAADNAEVR